MKIAFVGHLGEISGSGMAMLQWALLCKENGLDCCISMPEGPIHQRAVGMGLTTVVYPLSRSNLQFGTALHYWRNRRTARSFLKEWLDVEKPDWIMVHSSANVLAVPVIRKSGIKCLWHIHEEFERPWNFRQGMKRRQLLSAADRLAFASVSGLQNFGVGTRPAKFLPNPLNHLDRLLQLERTPAIPARLLFNGTSHRKGIDLFLRSLHYLLAEHPELAWEAVVLGKMKESDPWHLQLQQMALGLPGRVRFAGIISAGEMEAHYTESALVVSASRQESRPIFLVEALAAGVPVIATRTGDCELLLKGGEFGTLIDQAGDVPSQLGTAIFQILQQRQSSQTQSSRAFISHEYDRDNIFAQLQTFLDSGT